MAGWTDVVLKMTFTTVLETCQCKATNFMCPDSALSFEEWTDETVSRLLVSCKQTLVKTTWARPATLMYKTGTAEDVHVWGWWHNYTSEDVTRCTLTAQWVLSLLSATCPTELPLGNGGEQQLFVRRQNFAWCKKKKRLFPDYLIQYLHNSYHEEPAAGTRARFAERRDWLLRYSFNLVNTMLHSQRLYLL